MLAALMQGPGVRVRRCIGMPDAPPEKSRKEAPQQKSYKAENIHFYSTLQSETKANLGRIMHCRFYHFRQYFTLFFEILLAFL
jgi:hypothetical protein